MTHAGPSWLISELRRIRPSPATFLGDERVTSLACYIRGIIRGLERAGVIGTKEERFLAAFGAWLGDQLRLPKNDCWFYCERLEDQYGGEANDVKQFFQELTTYLEELGYRYGLDEPEIDLDRVGVATADHHEALARRFVEWWGSDKTQGCRGLLASGFRYSTPFGMQDVEQLWLIGEGLEWPDLQIRSVTTSDEGAVVVAGVGTEPITALRYEMSWTFTFRDWLIASVSEIGTQLL